MSFGNRASFASLKDAYGILNFTSTEQDNYKIEEPVQQPIKQIVEKFEEELPKEYITCDMVKSHCSDCNCMAVSKYGPVGTWLNEILNISLICILIYILMYQPKI